MYYGNIGGSGGSYQIGSSTTLRGMMKTTPKQKAKKAHEGAQETPQEKASRVANELDLCGTRGPQHIGPSFMQKPDTGFSYSSLNKDGMIEGSVWNDYVDAHFNSPEEAKQGKHHVKNNITVRDAMKSLYTYFSQKLDK